MRACLTDRLRDGHCAQLDLQRLDRRAGDGQHQRRGVAEIALELHRRGALRKTSAESLEFEIDVAELFAAVAETFGELHVDEGKAGQ